MEPVTPSLFEVAEGIRYRFFTRRNGVSEGEYSSLNCSIQAGDDPAKVRENMRRVALNLGCTVEKIFVLHQTHSSQVVTVQSREPFEKTPYADALVTDCSNIYLGIKTADCAPVLFADVENRVIGAAHAGWRGAVGGILENTLSAMEEIGAKIEVDSLMAVGEIFFPWGDRPCHQICLYYKIHLCDPAAIPLSGIFHGYDELVNERIDLDFCWVPLEKLRNGVKVYPQELIGHILSGGDKVLHFVSRQI